MNIGRTLLLTGLVTCGAASPQVESTAAPSAKPEAPPTPTPVMIELVRRPPVGTRWHELRTYARDQDAAMPSAAFAHHYHDEIEADVTVVEQAPLREVVLLTITRHESIVDGRPYPGVQSPGARIRIERTPQQCKATDASGAPLDHNAVERLFSHVFDCELQSATGNDDDLLGMRAAHHVGETWSMARASIAGSLHVADADITRATVSLEAAANSFVVTATYMVPSAGALGTIRKVVPNDPKAPLLATQTDIIRETHERLRRSAVCTRIEAGD